MHIHRSAVELVIQAPAKLNLFFEVLAKRNDGYHEIETLMCPIDLYDTLYFQEDSERTSWSSRCRRVFGAGGPSGRGLHEVPEGPDNLVVRAVELVRRRAGVRRGARVAAGQADSGGGRAWAADRAMRPPRWWPPTRAGGSADRATSWPSGPPNWAATCRSSSPAGRRSAGDEENGWSPSPGWAGSVSWWFIRLRACRRRPCTALSAGRAAADRFSRWWMHCGEETGDRRAGGCGIGLQPAAERLSPWVKRLQQEFSRTGLPRARDEWEWHVVLWTLPSRSPCAAQRTTFTGKGAGAVFAVRSCR